MLIYDVLHKETIYHSIVDDLRNFGVKYRFKKSAFKTERLERMKNISKKIFKTPLSYQPLDVVNLSSGGIVHVPVFVIQASTFLEKYITQEGLFRKAGSQVRQKELIARLDNGGALGEKHYAIDVANCLKTFFRELPEPLIPYTYHDLFIHCVMLKAGRAEAVLLACILLPPHHLNTLAFFMEFLKKVSFCEKQNKMGIDNLAKVVGPNIMPLQETTMSAVQMRLELHLLIVKILIENAENIGILPDRITQAISMETIGSTDNELDLSESQSRLKSKKKKHRSGSLTRMFNGLKKIVGKGGSPDDNNVTESQRLSVNQELLHVSNVKSTKKRKVIERLDPPSTKKKRGTDKSDKSKKIRLSLDRFVPKTKPKVNDGDLESYMNTFDSYTERRWSSVSNSYDSQRKCRLYSNGSQQLQMILKDNDVANTELQREYNNVFIDADVNLSDDSDEQVLLMNNSCIESNTGHPKLSSSFENLKTETNFDQMSLCTPKKRLTINDFETYSHIKTSSMDDDSEEYVTIPKSEYEDIKNRVFAIESRLSQEFGYASNEENVSLLAHSVKKVQTAYEKTLEEAGIENTATADYLAKKLGKELKIRRSSEHKIIRSPSARKIGSLRRRSQEKIMSKRVRRTASWHISHEFDLQSHPEPNEKLGNAYSINERGRFSSNYMQEGTYQPRPASAWEKEKNNILSNTGTQASNAAKRVNCDLNSHETLQPLKNRSHSSVRRVSSFHGKEFISTDNYFSENVEKLKKTTSQQNILNNAGLVQSNGKTDGWRKTIVSWKDAEGYFKSTNSVNTPVTQTGRASIAKLRTQNAGMVLAKAKLFDERTSKTPVQGHSSNKKQEFSSASNERFINTSKHREAGKQNLKLDQSKRNEPCRKASKGTRSKKATDVQNSKVRQVVEDDRVNPPSTVVSHGKENVAVKVVSTMKKVPINTIEHDSRLSMYKPDSNVLCRTPHIKKPLVVKTPKSSKGLVRKSVNDSRRTPLKAVGQLSTPKYQSPKGILKVRNLSRHT